MNILGQTLRSALQYRPIITGLLRQCPATAGVPYLHYSKSSKSTLTGADGDAPAKKTRLIPKITLVGTDQSISIVNLEEAQKISKRRDLKLVKVVDLDLKTQRPVYKLMTSAEYLSEDLKRREEKKRSKQQAVIKGDKLLTISARISHHDLNSKIQHILKWLRKSYEVRIVISRDGDKLKQESIASQIENGTKEVGKIVQKRFRDNDLRFQLLPDKSIVTDDTVPTATASPVEKKDLLKQSIVNDTQSARAFHTERTLA